MNNKKLYNKAHNPTKRETEPYKEGNKNDIRHSPKPYKEDNKTWPYKEGSNIVQQKYNTKLNNNKQTYSTTTTTTKKKKTTQLQQHQTTQILTTIVALYILSTAGTQLMVMGTKSSC